MPLTLAIFNSSLRASDFGQLRHSNAFGGPFFHVILSLACLLCFLLFPLALKCPLLGDDSNEDISFCYLLLLLPAYYEFRSRTPHFQHKTLKIWSYHLTQKTRRKVGQMFTYTKKRSLQDTLFEIETFRHRNWLLSCQIMSLSCIFLLANDVKTKL